MKIDTPKISNLTSNGFVKTTGSDGSLSVDTNTYGPAGSNTQIQFNNNGAFGATSGLTWDGKQFNSPSEVITGTAEFTGTGTVGASGTTVTGSGTLFLTEAKVGGNIRTNAGTRIITAISNNTTLTVDSSFSQSAGRTVYFKPPVLALKNSAGNAILSFINTLNSNSILYTEPSTNVTNNTHFTVSTSGSPYFKIGDGSVGAAYLKLRSTYNGDADAIYVEAQNGSSEQWLNVGGANITKLMIRKADGEYMNMLSDVVHVSTLRDFDVYDGEVIVNNGGVFDHEAQMKVVGQNACSGTATECNTIGTQTPCEAQLGCTWGYQADSCTGTLVCGNQGSQGACEAIGCIWQETQCSIYNSDYANCSANSPPCSWECANCNIWDNDQTNCEANISSTGCSGCTWTGSSPSDCYGSPTYNCLVNGDESSCNADPLCTWNGGMNQCDNLPCDTWDNDGTNCQAAGCGWTPAINSSCTGNYSTTLCTGTLTSGCGGSPTTSCGALTDTCGGSSNCSQFTDEPSCSTYAPTCFWDGMVCIDYTGCSALESQGSTICNGCGCTWVSQTCTDYSSHGGDCTYTAAGNQCSGSVTPCSSINTQTPCETQDGCSWTFADAIKGVGHIKTTGAAVIGCIKDAQASNNSYFCGSEHSNKGCYKDDGGVVHVLY